jgi:PKHD-type hydroxylase
VILLLRDVLSADEADRIITTLDYGDGTRDVAAQIILTSLRGHPLVSLGLHPRRFSIPRFSHGEPATDTDNGIPEVAPVVTEEGVRADVGIAVFLSDPATYAGGELTLNAGFAAEPVEQVRGACVAYPAAATLHLEPVTRGTQWIAHVWVQSLIRDPEQREILYDIGCSLGMMDLFGQISPAMMRLQRSYQNLLRLWADG